MKNEWIETAEHKPDKGQRVIAYHLKRRFMAMFWFEPGNGTCSADQWVGDTGSILAPTSEPTHWVPLDVLPELPE